MSVFPRFNIVNLSAPRQIVNGYLYYSAIIKCGKESYPKLREPASPYPHPSVSCGNRAALFPIQLQVIGKSPRASIETWFASCQGQDVPSCARHAVARSTSGARSHDHKPQWSCLTPHRVRDSFAGWPQVGQTIMAMPGESNCGNTSPILLAAIEYIRAA
jgi:hypothetical protein